jgi:beta-phosphoglucomutase
LKLDNMKMGSNKVKSILQHKKAVIFDLDGVLVDTAVFHFQAWRRLANEIGFDFTEHDNEQLKGVSRLESLEKILKWAEKDVDETGRILLADKKNKWYLEWVRQMKDGDVLPGTIVLLTFLREENKKIALGSASKNAPEILERTGIASYFIQARSRSFSEGCGCIGDFTLGLCGI